MKLKLPALAVVLLLCMLACNQGSRTSSYKSSPKTSTFAMPQGESPSNGVLDMALTKPKKPEEIGKNEFLSADTTNFNTEDYDPIIENPFLSVSQNPLSTFSIDVDDASYSNVRR